ncbi:MAG: YARHG domain-containing protein, partial [Verrucomicrobia bacterium]
ERLRQIRNLPYALNGYIFKDRELAKYYDSKWIIPKDKNFSDSNFSKSERKFIERVKSFEEKKE